MKRKKTVDRVKTSSNEIIRGKECERETKIKKIKN